MLFIEDQVDAGRNRQLFGGQVRKSRISVSPHVDTQVVQTVGGFSARGARISAASSVDSAQVLRESTTVRKSAAAAPTDVRFRAGMSHLVRAKPLLRFEGFAALRAHVAGRHLGLVDHLVSVEGRGGLE